MTNMPLIPTYVLNYPHYPVCPRNWWDINTPTPLKLEHQTFFGLHENMEVWNHADEFNLTVELKMYYCKTWEIM